jgi:hypothetical protein
MLLEVSFIKKACALLLIFPFVSLIHLLMKNLLLLLLLLLITSRAEHEEI